MAGWPLYFFAFFPIFTFIFACFLFFVFSSPFLYFSCRLSFFFTFAATTTCTFTVVGHAVSQASVRLRDVVIYGIILPLIPPRLPASSRYLRPPRVVTPLDSSAQ
jgi:hypothetical protein